VFTKENLNNCPNKGNSPYQTMSDIKCEHWLELFIQYFRFALVITL
jgi:hypothetical protein